MKRLIAAGLACGLLAGAAGGLAAKDVGPWGGAKAKLGISDEQAAKLKAARRAHRDAVTPLRDKLADEMEKLRSLVKEEGKDKEIEAALSRLKDLHKSMQAQRERFMEASAAVLTPTQRAKALLGMAKRMRGAFHKRMRMHGPMGPHDGPGMRGRRGGWGGGGMKDAPADIEDDVEVEMDVEEGPEDD